MTTPTNTTVTQKVRSATSSTDQSSIIGDFSTLPQPTITSQYQQFALNFATGDPTQTPTVSAVDIDNYDITSPTVSDVTSTTANGSYKAGQTINARATFSENVTITGTPRIKLQTNNGTDKYATYSGGTGSTNIDFTYTVQTGDNSADLDYFDITSLELNSGTIKDAAGNDATLTLFSPGAAHSLGNNKNIVLDTTVPTITITNPNTNPAQSKTITASATENATLSYHINNSGVDTCDSSLAFTAYSSLTFSSESDNHKKVCYKAEDAVGNISYSLSNAISGIDTHAPTLSNLAPDSQTFSVTTTSKTLTLDTTETSNCKYATTTGTAYSSMTEFDSTDSTTHSTFISGLSSGTTYNYYLKCQDPAGNTSNESSLSFTIAPEENHLSLNSVMVKIKRTWNKFKDTIHSSGKKLKLKQKDSQLANGTVKIYSNNQRIKTISVDSSGAWDYLLKLKDDATKNLKLKFFDSYGTLIDTAKAKVKIDTEKPTFTIFPPEGKVIYTKYQRAENRRLVYQATDNQKVKEYKIEFNGKIHSQKISDQNQIQSFFIPIDTPQGSYSFSVTASDQAGNTEKREAGVTVR